MRYHGVPDVIGSQARILYADCPGRVAIAVAMNNAVASGILQGPVAISRDHHDVSGEIFRSWMCWGMSKAGTDSPYRETANIIDGSRFTADMAVHTFVGNACRGATWVSLHNGGGVGWGEASCDELWQNSSDSCRLSMAASV